MDTFRSESLGVSSGNPVSFPPSLVTGFRQDSKTQCITCDFSSVKITSRTVLSHLVALDVLHTRSA